MSKEFSLRGDWGSWRGSSFSDCHRHLPQLRIRCSAVSSLLHLLSSIRLFPSFPLATVTPQPHLLRLCEQHLSSWWRFHIYLLHACHDVFSLVSLVLHYSSLAAPLSFCSLSWDPGFLAAFWSGRGVMGLWPWVCRTLHRFHIESPVFHFGVPPHLFGTTPASLKK